MEVVVCMCAYTTCASVEDKGQLAGLSSIFHFLDPRNWTVVTRLGRKDLTHLDDQASFISVVANTLTQGRKGITLFKIPGHLSHLEEPRQEPKASTSHLLLRTNKKISVCLFAAYPLLALFNPTQSKVQSLPFAITIQNNPPRTCLKANMI